MGSVFSNESPVMLQLIVPSKGDKVLKSRFVSEVPAPNLTIEEFYQLELRHLVPPEACGELQSVSVVLIGSPTEQVDVGLRDNAKMYVKLGLSRVIFKAEQAGMVPAHRAASRDIADVLVRQRDLELPMWSHSGRPSLTQLFSELRRILQKDGMGFKGSVDLKMGSEWMLSLCQILYKLSPFHSKLKSRGCSVPDVFSFSKGANDFKKKGKSEPLLNQELLREVSEKRCRLSCA